ncbi:MAG: CoA transferase [Dehalococcoidia bacterium]|jgi:crotonobetainyl-CoA:carnitine CoA-transferase CaiB-like acyl-CoA transferase|nr:CoA transferase [Dehalococcoidia bacterium]
MAGALKGIRILEMAVWHAGPGATLMLSDMGAEVVKIEQPGVGDPMRGLVKLEGADILNPQGLSSLMYEIPNRNKKSITVDLTKPQGREIVYRLIPKFDVFMQNFRPGVAAQLGMDYDTLKKHNPKLIYANVSGYGPKGPDGGARGQDYIGLARSGMMTAAYDSDPNQLPHMAPGMADQMTSVTLCWGILAALLARERQGVSQEIHVSIVGSMINLQLFRTMASLFLNQEFPPRQRTEMANPLYNHYRCKDDKWVALAVLASDRVWPVLCECLGMTELIDDPRFNSTEKRADNCRELIGIMDRIFDTKTRDEWMQILRQRKRIICSPVMDILELPNDPQVTENNYIVDYDHPSLENAKVVGFPVTFTETPCAIQAPAPQFGQHTEEVLIELGDYTWDDIAKLREEEAI